MAKKPPAAPAKPAATNPPKGARARKAEHEPTSWRDAERTLEWIEPAQKGVELDQRNARRHPDRNTREIAASLQRLGPGRSVVIQQRSDGSRVVRAGNGTVTQAKAVGVRLAAVVVHTDDDAGATAYGLADNKIAMSAEWDDEALAGLLREMDADARALAGFDPDDVSALLDEAVDGKTDPDEVPAVPDEPVSKTGDVWVMGEHRLLCGDSTRAEDVAKVMAGEKPFIMVTDPPYGVEYDPDWRNEAKRPDGTPYGAARTGEVQNDDEADWTKAWELFAGDVAYVWHAGRHAATVILNLAAAGLNPRSQVIWVKPRFAISRGHYHWQHEPCWYAVRKNTSAKWCGDRSQSTTWEIGLKDDTGDTNHGTQKPVECMERPIRNHGGKDDAVYEPFSGSGTTIIAATRQSRRCYAIEIEPKYVDVAVRRWCEYTGLDATRESDGASFRELTGMAAHG